MPSSHKFAAFIALVANGADTQACTSSAWFAMHHICVHTCVPQTSQRPIHPLRGVRVGEAKNPGPVSSLLAQTQQTILDAFSQSSSSRRRAQAMDASHEPPLLVSIATPREGRWSTRYQVRSKPALIGQDRKSQLAALQAWLRAHEQEITADSVTLIQKLLTSWQDQRQHAAAEPAAGHPRTQEDAHASERLSWQQFNDIASWIVPTQRHLPKALQSTVRTLLRGSLTAEDPFGSDPQRPIGPIPATAI
eukprot:1634162-Amphidinium_carterae.3